jgi:GNAT superfamily N-acetyltransferase
MIGRDYVSSDLKDIKMPDMLVNLLKVPSLDRLNDDSINIRRAQPFELTPVREFICQNFSRAWADEISVGFANKPISVVLATRDGRVIGFAGYECTRKAFFGPTGVSEKERGRGVGTALLIASLWGLRELGYVYAIIGSAGPADFYERTVGATVIPDSEPGIYVDLLK